MTAQDLWYRTYQNVIRIHDLILEESGGEPGILSPGTIQAAIERARWGPFPGAGDLWVRAAFLLRGIAQEHPFVDGNKRTAIHTVDLFLTRNGWSLVPDEEALFSAVIEIARGRLELQGIADRLRSNAEKA